VIITVAIITSRLVYDTYVKVIGYNITTNWNVFPIGVLLAGLAQSVTILGILTVLGFFQREPFRQLGLLGSQRT
jgi:hypothetical protein